MSKGMPKFYHLEGMTQEDLNRLALERNTLAREVEKLEDNWNKLKQWCIENIDAERKEKWKLIKFDKSLEAIIENDIYLYNKMLAVIRDLESELSNNER